MMDFGISPLLKVGWKIIQAIRDRGPEAKSLAGDIKEVVDKLKAIRDLIAKHGNTMSKMNRDRLEASCTTCKKTLGKAEELCETLRSRGHGVFQMVFDPKTVAGLQGKLRRYTITFSSIQGDIALGILLEIREQFHEWHLLPCSNAVLNKRDGDGRTPLHNAIDKGDRRLVRFLLSQGADPSKTTHRSKTNCVHQAVERVDLELLKILRQHYMGPVLRPKSVPQPSHLGNMRQNSLQMAMEERRKQWGDLLRAPCATNLTPLHLAMPILEVRLVDFLVRELPFDAAKPRNAINARDIRGRTPLHTLAGHSVTSESQKKNMLLIADILLRHGHADPRLVDSEKLTAAQVAKATGHQQLAKFLENHTKAVVEAANKARRALVQPPKPAAAKAPQKAAPKAAPKAQNNAKEIVKAKVKPPQKVKAPEKAKEIVKAQVPGKIKVPGQVKVK